MDEQRRFTKLSSLVDSQFTIERVGNFVFKKWDTEKGKMVTGDQWFEGARRLFSIDTDKGTLDLSEGQLGSIFVKLQHAGQSNVIGATVQVKSNGKTGMDIRYYLNPVKTRHTASTEPTDHEEEPLW